MPAGKGYSQPEYPGPVPGFVHEGSQLLRLAWPKALKARFQIRNTACVEPDAQLFSQRFARLCTAVVSWGLC